MTAAARYSVEMLAPFALARNSYIIAGLFELERQGEITLRIRPDFDWRVGRITANQQGYSEEPNAVYGSVSRFRVLDTHRGREASFCFDAADRADTFPLRPLKECDKVFKVNVFSPCRRGLGVLGAKIRPAGLKFNVRSTHARSLLRLNLAYIVFQLFGEHKSWRDRYSSRAAPQYLLMRAKKALRWRSLYRSIPPISAYEHEASEEIHPYVLYQVGCFRKGSRSDYEVVNSERASLLQALNSRLGNNFVGGFVPSEAALASYPQLVTKQPSDREGYLKLVRKASAVIYTRGVEHSIARKLAEYLASSKCVIAQRPEREFRRALRDRREVLFFDTVDECVDLCRELLSNPRLAREIATSAGRYYEDEVAPAANALHTIKASLGNAPG